MNLDFNRYFLPERRIFLDNVEYEMLELTTTAGEKKLDCKDTIVAQRNDAGVKITFNRTITFQPEGVFRLSVTFGALLTFHPQKKDELDWTKIDIAGEFRKNGGPLLGMLMSRTSLLIAQITSSSGQVPLITPAAPK